MKEKRTLEIEMMGYNIRINPMKKTDVRIHEIRTKV